jgi:hypothetical protein
MRLDGRHEVLAMRHNIRAACRANGIQIGTGHSSTQPTLLSPVSYKLKRERNPQ